MRFIAKTLFTLLLGISSLFFIFLISSKIEAQSQSVVTTFTLQTSIEGGKADTKVITAGIYKAGILIPSALSFGTLIADNKLILSGLSLPGGNYDIVLKTTGYLEKKITNVTLYDAGVYQMSGFLAGDLDNNGSINSTDWSVMKTDWGTANTRSDINRDGKVNSIDFSYLNKNWGEVKKSETAVMLTPVPSEAGVVVIEDLDSDGQYTGNDINLAFTKCVPGCTLRALPRIYKDVAIVIPQTITNPLIIEGAGMEQTVFSAPVPWVQPVFWVKHNNPSITFRDFTIDGRKGEQVSALSVTSVAPFNGINVQNPWGQDSGPGLIERVEVKNMLNVGVHIINGRNWIVRNSKIHDNGCSNEFPCPLLTTIQPDAIRNNPTWQSVGFGIVFSGSFASGGIANNNEVWNITKIGIEAYTNGPTDFIKDYQFYNNSVRRASGGIVSNGGEYGRIENNTVTDSVGAGISCVAGVGNIIFNDNTSTDNGGPGLWVGCWGPNVTVTNNTTKNNCKLNVGGGSGLQVAFNKIYHDGLVANLIIKNNVVNESLCGSASYISQHNGVEITGNDFQGGKTWGILMLDLQNVSLTGNVLNGKNIAKYGIELLQNIDGVTIHNTAGITGYTGEKIFNANTSTVTNILQYSASVSTTNSTSLLKTYVPFVIQISLLLLALVIYLVSISRFRSREK